MKRSKGMYEEIVGIPGEQGRKAMAVVGKVS